MREREVSRGVGWGTGAAFPDRGAVAKQAEECGPLDRNEQADADGMKQRAELRARAAARKRSSSPATFSIVQRPGRFSVNCANHRPTIRRASSSLLCTCTSCCRLIQPRSATSRQSARGFSSRRSISPSSPAFVWRHERGSLSLLVTGASTKRCEWSDSATVTFSDASSDCQ